MDPDRPYVLTWDASLTAAVRAAVERAVREEVLEADALAQVDAGALAVGRVEAAAIMTCAQALNGLRSVPGGWHLVPVKAGIACVMDGGGSLPRLPPGDGAAKARRLHFLEKVAESLPLPPPRA